MGSVPCSHSFCGCPPRVNETTTRQTYATCSQQHNSLLQKARHLSVHGWVADKHSAVQWGYYSGVKKSEAPTLQHVTPEDTMSGDRSQTQKVPGADPRPAHSRPCRGFPPSTPLVAPHGMMLVHQPGVKPMSPALAARRLNHWTSGKSLICFLLAFSLCYLLVSPGFFSRPLLSDKETGKNSSLKGTGLSAVLNHWTSPPSTLCLLPPGSPP